MGDRAWMVGSEEAEALFEEVELFRAVQLGYAYAHSVLMTARC